MENGKAILDQSTMQLQPTTWIYSFKKTISSRFPSLLHGTQYFMYMMGREHTNVDKKLMKLNSMIAAFYKKVLMDSLFIR